MDELIEEFKNRNHITHSYEDSSIEKMLSFSMQYIKSRCGEFETDSDNDMDMLATELVLERTRYVYNEAVEYFEDNFLSEITALGIMNSGDSDEG